MTPEQYRARLDAGRERPLWRWILLALSPSLVYLAVASLCALISVLTLFGVLLGLVVPLVALFMLARLADDFFTVRDDRSTFRRVLFFLGFGLVNAMIWFGGCGLTMIGPGGFGPMPPKPRPAVEAPAATPSDPPATSEASP